MATNVGQVTSAYAPAQTSIPSKSAGTSSSSDILTSFKEILSLMSMTNNASGSGGSSGLSMGDLMAPLMLILLEKLVEQQVDQSQTATTGTTPAGATASTATSSTTSQTSKAEPSGRPVTGGWVSQEFHPGHTGIDLAVPTGTEVKSTMDGNVIYAGWNDQGYGNLVIVENGAYRTYYAHLSSIPVSVGETVTAGTTIGLSGNTGHSTGPHLHYEIRKNKVPIDPAPVTLNT